MNTADLLIDAKGSEIKHRTGLTAPDAFFYLRVQNEDMVWFDAREYGIQKQHLEEQEKNVTIQALEPHMAAAKADTRDLPMPSKVLSSILQAYNVNAVRISPNLPYRWVQLLQQLDIQFEVYEYSREQLCKTAAEIELLKQAQAVTNQAFDVAKTMLEQSAIVGDTLQLDGKTLTCETLKQAIQVFFLTKNYSCPESLIVASKEQTARPHDEGSGIIFAHEPIIIDLFPRNNATGYFADMTRSFVKGTPSDAFTKQYEAVRTAQQAAVDCAEVGKSCNDVHAAAVERFTQSGFITANGEGFIHGTGHGLGLQVHEAPSVSSNNTLLEAGMCITIEPGLYYKQTGGVRIEDVIVFHADGSKENINTYPKDFIIP